MVNEAVVEPAEIELLVEEDNGMEVDLDLEEAEKLIAPSPKKASPRDSVSYKSCWAWHSGSRHWSFSQEGSFISFVGASLQVPPTKWWIGTACRGPAEPRNG